MAKLALRLFMWHKRKQPAPELFVSGWNFVTGFMVKLLQAASQNENWQFRWEDTVFVAVYANVKMYWPDFLVPLKVIASDATLDELGQGKGGLIAVPHTDIKSAYALLLEQLGARSAHITVNPANHEYWGRELGMKSVPSTMPKDGHSLVVAKRRVRAGEFVVNAVDYQMPAKGFDLSPVYVSPNFFRFAQLVQARLYFAVAFATKSGELAVAVERAPVGNEEELFLAMTAFIEKNTGRPKSWILLREPVPTFVPRFRRPNPVSVAG